MDGDEANDVAGSVHWHCGIYVSKMMEN
jgi:hypothetical protein